MYWCKKLYYGRLAGLQQKMLLKTLKRRRWLPGLYVISLSDKDGELLEMYDTAQFVQPPFKDKLKSMRVAGIALGRNEAYELVRTIVDDAYRLTGNLDLAKYLN
ncbi:MAG: hypothetical protein HDT13_08535 [Butyrivibrio sp.]|nr:hypothetical protein [Butyrivibrio sp.]